MSIRVKLLLLFGLMVAFGMAGFVALWLYGVPVLGVEGMVSNEYRRSIVAVEALADKERDTFERWFTEHRRELRMLSASEDFSRAVAGLGGRPSRQTPAVQAAMVRQLSLVKEASPGVYNYLYVLEPVSGRVLAAVGRQWSLAPQAHRPLLQEAAEPGMTEFVSVVYEDQGAGLLVTSQIMEMDADGVPTGKLVGILVAGVVLGAPLQVDQSSIRQSLGLSGAVLLVDTDGRILFNSREESGGDQSFVARQVVSGTEGVKVLTPPLGSELIAAFRHIHLGASHELSLAVTRDTDDALAAIRGSFLRMAGLMALILLLSVGLVVVATNRIAEAEAEIFALNASLEDRIEQRTRELERTNENLTETLGNLERTRGDLVRSEKMAALGSLVAGVAHELNTPIGNSLTVASTLHAQADAFAADMATGLKRSTLDTYVANAREGADILMRSLHRAADLVSSFKQVAVDQTSVNRRTFQLNEMTNELLITLGPGIRKTTHSVVSTIPEGIRMESYPGPLGQVLTNLINNALVHAFDGRQNGRVTVNAALNGRQQVVITVRDNGAGIPAANLERVFDPFFTTKLGHGGSGLGLSIVFNLVQDALGGSIQVDSPPGQGACFTVTLPLVTEVVSQAHA